MLEFKYPALLPPFPFVYTFITIWPWSLKVPASCFLLPITSTPDRFFFAADTGVFHRKRNASARNAIIAIHVIENVRAAAGLTLPAAPAAANLPILPGYTCSSVFLIKRFISSPFCIPVFKERPQTLPQVCGLPPYDFCHSGKSLSLYYFLACQLSIYRIIVPVFPRNPSKALSMDVITTLRPVPFSRKDTPASILGSMVFGSN